MADNQEATMETIAAALDLDVDAVKEMYGFYDFSTEITDATKKVSRRQPISCMNPA